nr:ATP-binding protein [Alkalilimnicola ehrlichii]
MSEDQARVELNEVLDDILDLLQPPPHIQVQVDPLPTVWGEPARIHQVFQNLLSNAIRYMDKPQGRVHVGCADEGAMWRFSVADNGPGIGQQHRERIFQLFQTLAPRDRTESTGIGLSLVKKIVELYGGRVWLKSTLGEGATFYFTWPKQARESEL